MAASANKKLPLLKCKGGDAAQDNSQNRVHFDDAIDWKTEDQKSEKGHQDRLQRRIRHKELKAERKKKAQNQLRMAKEAYLILRGSENNNEIARLYNDLENGMLKVLLDFFLESVLAGVGHDATIVQKLVHLQGMPNHFDKGTLAANQEYALTSLRGAPGFAEAFFPLERVSSSDSEDHQDFVEQFEADVQDTGIQDANDGSGRA